MPIALNDIGGVADTVHADRTAGYKTWDVTPMVQDWVSNPSENYGLLIVPEDYTAADSHRFFASSENANAEQRPRLVVSYSAGAAPHRADTDGDGCIDEPEVMSFIDRWKLSSQDVPMRELIEAIGLHLAGTGCPD